MVNIRRKILIDILLWGSQNNNAAKNVLTLTPETCECVILYEKRNLANGIKVMDIKIGRLSFGTWVFKSGRGKQKSQLEGWNNGGGKKDCKCERNSIYHCWSWRWGKQQRVGWVWPQEAEKGQQLTTSEKIGTSVLQPQGTEFSQRLE